MGTIFNEMKQRVFPLEEAHFEITRADFTRNNKPLRVAFHHRKRLFLSYALGADKEFGFLLCLEHECDKAVRFKRQTHVTTRSLW